jgi:hypothetical protein
MKRPEQMKLLGVYNEIWKTGVFPTGWTEATVIPILKTGKDPNEPKNYLPISLYVQSDGEDRQQKTSIQY